MRVIKPLPFAIVALLAAFLPACGRQSAAPESSTAPAPAPPADTGAAAGPDTASAAPAPAPTVTETVTAAPASADPGDADDGRSTAAARALVQDYYAALDRGDYRTAYIMWGDNGARSGQSFSSFRSGFTNTADTAVLTQNPSDQHGAAGSIYITVPVDVRARLRDGTPQHFTGRYTLRRINDVPGASAQQLRWHIDKADLRRVD